MSVIPEPQHNFSTEPGAHRTCPLNTVVAQRAIFVHHLGTLCGLYAFHKVRIDNITIVGTLEFLYMKGGRGPVHPCMSETKYQTDD